MLDRVSRRLNSLKVDKTIPIIVGFSGGPDSSALLHALRTLEYETIAAHLNHGMRPEADRDADVLRSICEKLNIAFYLGNANVPLAAKELKIGVEEAGRNARYEFLHRLSIQLGGALIATGHTQDDHVETVLLNLTRGSGLDGLRGIPDRRGNIIRPLIDVSRADTCNYCAAMGLTTLFDPGNENTDFSRVRVRKRVVPELQAINPSLSLAISRLASNVREEVEFLDGVSARMLEEAELLPNGALTFLSQNLELVLDRLALSRWPLPIIRRGLQLVAKTFGATFDYEQLAEIGQAVITGCKLSMTAEGGKVIATCTHEKITVELKPEAQRFRENLDLPGIVDSNEFGWTLKVGPAPWMQHSRDALEVCIDTTSLRLPIHFRNIEPGDKIVPLGFDGRRKVADLLSEAGLTTAARTRMPIICDMIEPIWVPGICVSQRVAGNPATKNPIRMTFGPLEPS